VANIKQQAKRIGQDAKRRHANVIFKSSLKTAIKKVEAAAAGNDVEAAKAPLSVAFKKLDKAVSKGIHHKNYVNRTKARLQRLVNDIGQSPDA
jgi:small subunit ribosomal protein S20